MTISIYYSCAVRSADCSSSTTGEQINFLKKYGNVLTEHLASTNTDLGKTDEEIYQQDIQWLTQADVVIANCSNASLGVGFVISQAVSMKKPILCLYNNSTKLSAMINGCNKCKKDTYNSMEEFETCIRKFMLSVSTCKKVFLCAKPGSGKSTVAAKLSFEFGYVNVSTGQILRDMLVKLKTDPTNQFILEIKKYMDNGEPVPANIMKKIVFERLTEPDCLTKGFVLDGYPPTLQDLKNLQDMNIKPDLILYFECSDHTAIARQYGRGERVTDTEEVAQKRIELFYANMTFLSDWMKENISVTINSELSPHNVIESVMNVIIHLFYGFNTTNYSYFPLTLNSGEVNSSKFHFHIDAPSHQDLCEVTLKVLQECPEIRGHIKIYPISQLSLGPQVTDSEHKAYNSMVNFHPIDCTKNEAFLTGKLGDHFNPEILQKVLEVVKNHQLANPTKKFMVELEEYVEEYELNQNGEQINHIIHEHEKIDLTDINTQFAKEANKHVPPFEMHFAVDVPKMMNSTVFNLNRLHNKCADIGMNVGGWFLFANQKNWAYRSNEFTNLNYEYSSKLLHEQAISLQQMLNTGYGNYYNNLGCSLEIVHGIWTIQ